MKFLFKSFFKNELDELEKLKADIKTYQAKEEELKTLKQSVLNSSSESNILKAKVNELNSDISNLKNQLKQKDSENSSQVSVEDFEYLKKDYSNLKALVSQRESEIHTLNQDKIVLINQIESLKNIPNNNQSSPQDLELLKQEINQLKSLLNQKDNELNNLNQEKNTINNKLEEIKADFEHIQKQGSGSQDLDLLRQENNQIKLAFAQKENELRTLEEQNKTYISSQNILRDKLALALKANDDYQRKVSDLDLVVKQLRESNNNVATATATPPTITTQQTTIQQQITEQPVLRSNRVQLPQQKTSIKNILVVDDSNIILMQVRKAMGSLPYHLQTASSAKKALEMLNTEAFDLIITDVNMPEMNGIDLTLKIRKEIKHLRVIIMTAFENAEMKKQQTNILFTDKPLSLGHVTNLINQMNEGNDFGKLNNLKLKDLIFMLVLSKKDEYILVTDANNNQGKIFLSCGDVIHAEYSNLKGKEAIDMIAKFEKPSLEVIEGKASERSINIDVNTILYSL